MSIYDDLIEFKRGLLERVRQELPKLHPVAQSAAEVDIAFIETQMEGYYRRLDLWYERVWTLHGLWLDPEDRVLRHQGNRAALTNREFELLQFLLAHPRALLHSGPDRGSCLVGFDPAARGGPQLRGASAEDPGAAGHPLRSPQPTGARLFPRLQEHGVTDCARRLPGAAPRQRRAMVAAQPVNVEVMPAPVGSG